MSITDIVGLFEPQTKTVHKLLGDTDSFYLVPDYQRPYRWTNDHVEELWEDLYDAWFNKLEVYFLGPMIFIRKENAEFEVVDGQQRLTTLIILLCVIRDYHLKEDKKISNAIKSMIDDKHRIRLIPQTKNYYQLIKKIIENDNIPEKKPDKKELENNLLLNTFFIFKEKLANLNSEDVKHFIEYIFAQVVVITIICSHKTQAIKLFQTLNTRGLELNNSDLIKSSLMYSLERNNNQNYAQRLKIFNETWAKIDTIAEQIKSVSTDELDNLFTFYAYYLLNRDIKSSIYEELEKQFKKKDPIDILFNFLNFIQELNDLMKVETKTMHALWYLRHEMYWKTILTTAKIQKFKHIKELTTALRNMYYCYWIGGFTRVKIKQISYNIIRWIKEKKSMKYIQQEIDRKIEIDYVVESVSENLNRDVYGKIWLVPLLILLEYKQTDDSRINFIYWDKKIHIEHVLPQSWQNSKEWLKNWKENKADIWVNKLGNLTLLSGKKNVGAGNKPFLDKKNIYERKKEGKTAFEITKTIAKEEKWTLIEVKKRHEKLIKEVQELFKIEFEST